MTDDRHDHDVSTDDTAASGPTDYLVRGMGLNASVRALAVCSTGVGAQMMRLHKSLPTAAAAVTRLSTACLLLGGTVKGREQVSLEIRCDGPLEGIYAIADAHGAVRATVRQPFVDLPPRGDGKFDVGAAVGQGILIVTKNLGLKEPYTGFVPLQTGEIASDMVEYFRSSEQKPAAMGLGELVDATGVRAAGGFLLQLFPHHDEADVLRLEEQVAALPPVSQLVAQGASPEDILSRLLPDLQIFERYPVHFRCTCSIERFERIMITLGTEELSTLIEEQAQTDLQCHFCNKIYTLDREHLEHLLAIARDGVN